MRGGETFGHLLHDPHGLRERRVPVLLQRRTERLPFEKGHHEVRDALGFAHVVNGNDVIVFDLRLRAGLAQEARFGFGIGAEIRQQHFERDFAVEARVVRAVHGTHPAAAQLRENAERAEVRRGGARARRAGQRGSGIVGGGRVHAADSSRTAGASETRRS